MSSALKKATAKTYFLHYDIYSELRSLVFNKNVFYETNNIFSFQELNKFTQED